MSEVTETDIKPEDQSKEEDNYGQPKMSKRAKRLARKARWDSMKKIKRKLQKEKRRNLPLEERTKMKRGGKSGKRKTNKKMKDSECKVHVVIDLSFDHLMSDKDITRCVNQVGRCYSSNRILENPMQFHITSFEGASKKAMEKQAGFVNWDAMFHQETHEEIFEKSRLVYLTSESTNVLDKLEDDKVYIIGGLVDHNSQKGFCHTLAAKKGIAHARLPIAEFIDMKTRSVLSIDQVFSVLAYVSNGMQWQGAILKSIPPRKNAQAKPSTDNADDDNDNDKDIKQEDETV